MNRPRTSVSESNRTIAKVLASAFATERPAVHAYWDDDHVSKMAIVECKDSPQPGVSSYATIGVSDCPLYKDKSEYPVRVELVGACASNCEHFANMLATAGFCIINTKWFCAPGVIYPGVVSMYNASATMKPAMFVPPFLWSDSLSALKLQDKTVAFLMMIPISEEEYQFAEAKGSGALESAFELKQIDVFDIHRESIF